MKKLFTKSRFKLALDCPTKLYYATFPDRYNDVQIDDDFLLSLAQGGFQVGALAKLYRGVQYDLSDLKGYDEPIKATNSLLEEHDDVVIAEAAFRWNNCFVRVDILEKHGDTLHLVEVKAKSFNSQGDSFLNMKGEVASKMVSYVYDVAFQKYVVQEAMPKYQVKASLMMADKSKRADIDHLNQLFAIRRDSQGQTVIDVADEAKALLSESKTPVLTAFDVDALCERIIAGETPEQQKQMGMPFKDFVQMTSKAFDRQERISMHPSGKCFKCEFRRGDTNLQDGHDECMRREGGFCDADFMRAQIGELWGGAQAPRNKWVKDMNYYFMDQITEELYPIGRSVNRNTDGLSGRERTWLQIAIATHNEELRALYGDSLQGNTYLDVEGLRKEMDSWQYPLHMIDFETTAVALPMYKGLRPYEQVAFQYSHHIIEKHADGSYSIRHAGQYLNEDVGRFPNFEFVRHLRAELMEDEGTIFRYSHHENTILRAIYIQLELSEEPDKKELMEFINLITHVGEDHIGRRDMVDLLAVVKSYFYQWDEMPNSNSIKYVLPAVLNISPFLQKKYSQAIYGREILSQNIDASSPIAWISYSDTGHVDNPYHLLPSVGELVDEANLDAIAEEYDEEDMTVANGGAALTAYTKLMFCKEQAWSDSLRTALLRYCELDTMAMVFIWEYFYHEINKKEK